MTDRPTREDALKALDKLYQLIREGNYMLAENPRNVLEAYIENGIVIDRDKVPEGKVLIDETEYRQLKNIQAVIQEQIDNYAALLAEKVGE